MLGVERLRRSFLDASRRGGSSVHECERCGAPSDVVYECRRCGTSVENADRDCPNCECRALAAYEIR